MKVTFCPAAQVVQQEVRLMLAKIIFWLTLTAGITPNAVSSHVPEVPGGISAEVLVRNCGVVVTKEFSF